MTVKYENILYEKKDHIVTFTLNRPEKHNCINKATNRELQHAWKRFRDDKDAFVAIITGAGEKAFCAGWDLNDAAALTEFTDYDSYRTDVYNSEGYCGYTRRADIFKPIIAAVNGYAFAAGLETALLADIRIGAENAEFGVLERRWNIVAGDGLAVRLDKKCWTVPPIFKLIQDRGNVDPAEMFRVFNMGIGMAIICAPDNVSGLTGQLSGARVIGEVVRQVGDKKVIIE